MSKIMILDEYTDCGIGIRNGMYSNIDVYFPYAECNSVLFRLVRKVWIRLGLPKHVWYGMWGKKLLEYDCIIIDDSFYDKELVKYIKQHNKNVRLILYYYNPISTIHKLKNPNVIDRKNMELWSFDKLDCEQYGLNYNRLCFNQIVKKAEKNCYDVVFIGKDKGRKKYIYELEKQFTEKQLKSYIYILDDAKSWANQNITRFMHKLLRRPTNVGMPYDETVKFSAKSKAILEIVQNNQSSYTLRALESVFLEKKLITNNVNIKFEEFYNPNNVFILGEDCIENINEFMSRAVADIDKNILEKYTYDEWIKRFNL